jgi:threonine/homoserine/homoserine lactone efflux protein
MTWQNLFSFTLFAAVVTVIPGPDFAVILRNALAGGRIRGFWAVAGVTTSNALQGLCVAVGLGALVVASQPLFATIKWAGVGYLMFLGAEALRSAVRDVRRDATQDERAGRGARGALIGWRQGFTSNITNPKVLAFYLAVLPQFIPHGAPPIEGIGLALVHAVVSAVYLTLVTMTAHAARHVLERHRVHRAMHAITGTVMLGFCARLAFENA